jgi:hypothetical protein
MKPIAFPWKSALAAVAVSLLLAGCSISAEATAGSVRVENGQIAADRWSGGAHCGIEPGARQPCSAHSVRQRYP